jgi:hypothetical protein
MSSIQRGMMRLLWKPFTHIWVPKEHLLRGHTLAFFGQELNVQMDYYPQSE